MADNYLWGRLNKQTVIKDYTGVDTETTNITVNNATSTIKVDVKSSPRDIYSIEVQGQDNTLVFKNKVGEVIATCSLGELAGGSVDDVKINGVSVLTDKIATITVDGQLSNSTNPIMNSAVNTAVNSLSEDISAVKTRTYIHILGEDD